MDVHNMLLTRLMVMLVMLLMSPMMELLYTQMPQLHMLLPQFLLMLDRSHHQMMTDQTRDSNKDYNQKIY